MVRVSEQSVDILVHDKPIRQIAHNGKIYVVAKEGAQYEIRVRNNATSRVLGVCSVDGLNVVDGTEASVDGAGYIIHGYGSYAIKGYRTSNDEVHPFVFSKKGKSYAAKSEDGDVRNCGVIGVAFHAERKPKEIVKTVIEKEYVPMPYPVYPSWPYRRRYPWFQDEYWCSGIGTGGIYNAGSSFTYTCSSGGSSMQIGTQNLGAAKNQNTCNLVNVTSNFDMGTQFSDQSVEDRITMTDFERDGVLCQWEIYYASEKVLRKMGVPLDKASEVAFPQAFKQGFCKPPTR